MDYVALMRRLLLPAILGVFSLVPGSHFRANAATSPTNAPAARASSAAPAEDSSSGPTAAAAYEAIFTRNAFGLREPPPPPPPPEPTPTVTPSALKLTGITTLLSGKRAMFVVQEPGKPPVTSDLVREGSSDTYIKELEVIKIDEQNGAVSVKYGGKEMTLNFADNGLKPPVGPPPAPVGAPVPGRPVVTVGAPPTPQFASAAPVGAIAQDPNSRAIPQRPSRLPTASFGGPQIYGSYGAQQTPTIIPAQQMPTIVPAQPVISPEQQILNMKIQETVAAQQGVAMPPPLPIPGIDNLQPTTAPGQPGAGGPPPLPLPPGR